MIVYEAYFEYSGNNGYDWIEDEHRVGLYTTREKAEKAIFDFTWSDESEDGYFEEGTIEDDDDPDIVRYAKFITDKDPYLAYGYECCFWIREVEVQ